MNPDSFYGSLKGGFVNRKTIPSRFILRFFWPMIPESIPEKRPKTVKELELQLFQNLNRHSSSTYMPQRAQVLEKMTKVYMSVNMWYGNPVI